MEKTYGTRSTMNHRPGKTFPAPFLPRARRDNNYYKQISACIEQVNRACQHEFHDSRERGMLRISDLISSGEPVARSTNT